jgi:hypothetical protein
VNADWFYSVGDTRQGPVTEADLKRLAAEGRLKPTDLVWKDGMADWVEARTVPALFPARGQPARDADDRPSRRGRDDDDRPSRRGRDDYEDDRPSRRGRDDLDDDRPSRRGRRRDEDEVVDDDRPRVRRRDDDYDRYDDEYDRPRKKKLEKPGQVQAVAIMMLVGGILAILFGLAVPLSSGGICCFSPGPYYEIVVGILMIIRGVNMLNQDDQGPPRTLAILQIICLINFDLPNCVMGVVCLIMLNDPGVETYYRKRGYA